MNISGLVGHIRPQGLQECVAAINALPGAEVYHTDESSGRIVIIQEAQSTGEEVETFERIRAIPGILSLSLVYHQFCEPDAHIDNGTPVPSELEESI